MNQLSQILEESNERAAELRAGLKNLEALKAKLATLNDQEANDQKERDGLLAGGDFNKAGQFNELSARLQFYSAKRTALEAEIVASDKALQPILTSASQVLNRFSSYCSQRDAEIVTQFLKSVIAKDSAHCVEQLVANCIRHTALANAGGAAASGCAPLVFMNAKSFVSAAESTLRTLESLPAIVEAHAQPLAA